MEGFLYAIAAAVTWGLVYAIDQKVLYSVSPITLLFVDSILAALIMLPFVFFNDGSLARLVVSGKTNLLLILTAIALTTLANFFVLSGVKNLNASVASTLEISYPFFVVFFSFFLFRQHPNVYFFVGG